MILLLGFSFLAGLATILAPCVWPILPIVLSSSIGQGRARPLGISLGVVVSFAIFTLAISYLVKAFHFDPNIFRLFAVVVIAFLGFSMIIPALSRVTESLIGRLSGVFGSSSGQSSGFLGGFVTGLSLGIVWSPCAGPILAAIAALAATNQVSSGVVLITLAYSIGAGVPLLLFAYGGQQFIQRARGISPFTGRIQQGFGVLMILAALAIFTNLDKTLSIKLLEMFPGLGIASNSFENNQIVADQLAALKGQSSSNLPNMGQAPEFVGITKWLNPETPLTINSLKGKVVLVDFWTYTCINCLRTLPHVTAWYDRYKDQGLVVVGVHTPEFEFEKNTDNVLGAIKQFNIHYPVAQDNNYSTWSAYSNQYWPAEYLIDAKGNIRRTHFGEGQYDEMEKAIQDLLKEAGQTVAGGTVNLPDMTPKGDMSSETYLGSSRMDFLYPQGKLGNGTQTLTLANNIPESSFSLGGSWTISDFQAVTGKDATLEYNFNADKVFLVMRPTATGPAQVRVSLDGKVTDTITVDADKLYTLVDLKGNKGVHLLHLDFLTPGTQVFAFTFG